MAVVELKKSDGTTVHKDASGVCHVGGDTIAIEQSGGMTIYVNTCRYDSVTVIR